MNDQAWTGPRTENWTEVEVNPTYTPDKLDQMTKYFASVPRGIAFLPSGGMHKVWGCRKEEIPAKMKQVAEQLGLKTNEHKPGLWRFVKGE